HRDALQLAFADCLQHIGMVERLGMSLALECGLGAVDRAGAVGKKDEFEVDVLCRRRARPTDGKKNDREKPAKHHEATRYVPCHISINHTTIPAAPTFVDRSRRCPPAGSLLSWHCSLPAGSWPPAPRHSSIRMRS